MVVMMAVAVAITAMVVAFAAAVTDVLMAVAAAAYQQDNDENNPQAGVVVVHPHKTITSLQTVVFYAVEDCKEHDRLKNQEKPLINLEIEPLL